MSEFVLFLLVVASVEVFGLAYHFIIVAKPEDLAHTSFRLWPFLHWLVVGFVVAGSSTVVAELTQSYLFAAIATTLCLLAGLLLWQAIVAALRRQEGARRDDMVWRAYARSEEKRT